MRYMIIGRVVKESFYNGIESTVGYYVVGDNENPVFVTISEIYQLYINRVLRGIKDFDTESGEVYFIDEDKDLLPKYSFSLFGNNTGTIYSVSRVKGVCQLRDTNGNIQKLSEQDIIKGVKNGGIRLNNATVNGNGNSLSINKAIVVLKVYVENGRQIKFRVALPNGEITVLSADLIKSLIIKRKYKLFNAKIRDNHRGRILVHRVPTITKNPDGSIEEYADGYDYVDTFYIPINSKVEMITVRGSYFGTLINGKPHGKGVFRCTILPNDGCVISTGNYVMSDGNYVVFDGNYVDGIKQGWGTLEWSYSFKGRGNSKQELHYCFFGDIKDNYFDGKGTLNCYFDSMREHPIYEYNGIFEKGRIVDVNNMHRRMKQD